MEVKIEKTRKQVNLNHPIYSVSKSRRRIRMSLPAPSYEISGGWKNLNMHVSSRVPVYKFLKIVGEKENKHMRMYRMYTEVDTEERKIEKKIIP